MWSSEEFQWMRVCDFLCSFVGCLWAFFYLYFQLLQLAVEKQNHWNFSYDWLSICSCCYSARCAKCDNLLSSFFSLFLLLPVAYWSIKLKMYSRWFALIHVEATRNSQTRNKLFALSFDILFFDSVFSFLILFHFKIRFVAKIVSLFESNGNLAEINFVRVLTGVDMKRRRRKWSVFRRKIPVMYSSHQLLRCCLMMF